MEEKLDLESIDWNQWTDAVDNEVLAKGLLTSAFPSAVSLRTRSFESEEIVQYHFSDINWAQGQNMSHLINCQCINGYLKTLVRKLKLVSCF